MISLNSSCAQALSRTSCPDSGLADHFRRPSFDLPAPAASRAATRKCPARALRAPRSRHCASSANEVAEAMATEDAQGESRTSALEASDVSDLAEEALTWSALNGLLVGDSQGEASGTRAGMGMVHAPVTLLPSPFPAAAFLKAYALAPHLNALVDAVSRDREFLTTTLAGAAKSDSFTASLLDVYERTRAEEAEKRISLGMHRSDYMLDSPGGVGPTSLLQVELNTIASSFPGLSSRVTELHRHLLSRGLYRGVAGLGGEDWRLPPNLAAQSMAEALATAWRAQQSEPQSVVLMVVQPGERNIYDQRWLVQELWQMHRIRTVQRTLAEVQAQGELRGSSKQLWLGGEHATVVYYRAGYGPGDYPSDLEWQARLLLERSSAVSCPCVAYHLAGAKKVQQKLAEPGCLERFVPDTSVAQEIRSCFAGLWSLESEPSTSGGRGNGAGLAAPRAVQDALEQPERFVLKPQREGGGNNIYGEDVRKRLEEILASERPQESLAAYILMQRILPPVTRTLMMRRGRSAWVDSLSELGIYGTYVRSGEEVLLNKAGGHLLRTKTSSSDEGGVASGYAVLDSPYLY